MILWNKVLLKYYGICYELHIILTLSLQSDIGAHLRSIIFLVNRPLTQKKKLSEYCDDMDEVELELARQFTCRLGVKYEAMKLEIDTVYCYEASSWLDS